eukprot:m.155229 g.155229  ORF g.155229 m.155229 type:complete len:278 (-) comp16960_c0_seq5:1444-2277(-)
MFRTATSKEVQVLLESFGQPLPPLDHVTDKEATKLLCDELCQVMLEQGGKFIAAALRQASMRAEVARVTGLDLDSCKCFSKERMSSCSVCVMHCTSIGEGILTVLERDFVQILHGERAGMFDPFPGLQFLLSGICLGLLYQSVPEGVGMSMLVRSVLCIMVPVERWADAIARHGPLPYAPRSLIRQRSSTNDSTAESPIGRSRSPRSPGLRTKGAKLAKDANGTPICAECRRPLAAGVLCQCPCGAVTIRFERLTRKHSESSIAILWEDMRSRALTL